MPNAPHHNTPAYRWWAPRIRAAANANPNTICWRCGLTLEQHDQPTRWVAGHTIDGSSTWHPWLNVEHVPPVGDWLAPETARCNGADAARQTNAKRHGYYHGL